MADNVKFPARTHATPHMPSPAPKTAMAPIVTGKATSATAPLPPIVTGKSTNPLTPGEEYGKQEKAKRTAALLKGRK